MPWAQQLHETNMFSPIELAAKRKRFPSIVRMVSLKTVVSLPKYPDTANPPKKLLPLSLYLLIYGWPRSNSIYGSVKRIDVM